MAAAPGQFMTRATSLALLCAGFFASVVGCGSPVLPNVVLIILDTTRADHCSLYGYQRSTTPTLERLGAQGAVFEAAYSTTATTGPSHATLFTGVVPRRHKLVVNGMRFPVGIPTMAEQLSTAGYQTAGIVSSFVLDESFGLHRGFDVWEDDFDIAGSLMKTKKWMGHAVPEGFDRRADETTDLALNWVQNSRDPKRPFFLFVHYFEPHGPYDPPEPWRSRFAVGAQPSQLETWTAHYDGSIAFTDDEIARLIAGLDELGLTAETLIVVTADHGEGFNDHGVMAHGPHLYEEAVRIPLIVRWPAAVLPGTRVTMPVSLLDLQPTILELLGIQRPNAQVQGQSLVSLLNADPDLPMGKPVLLYRGPFRRQQIAGRWVEGERFGMRSGRWKYLAGNIEPAELYDVECDPEEKVNRILDHPEIVRRLHEELEAWLAEDPTPPMQEINLTVDERQGLKALGYRDVPEQLPAQVYQR